MNERFLYSLMGEFYATSALEWWDFRALQYPDQSLNCSTLRLAVKV